MWMQAEARKPQGSSRAGKVDPAPRDQPQGARCAHTYRAPCAFCAGAGLLLLGPLLLTPDPRCCPVMCDQTACSTGSITGCVSHSPSVCPSSDVVSTHLLCVFCWPALSILRGHGLPPDFLWELGSRPSLSDLLGELEPWITNEPSPPGGSGTFEPHPAHSTSGYRI